MASPNPPNDLTNVLPESQSPSDAGSSSPIIEEVGSIKLATPSDLTIHIFGPEDSKGKMTLHHLKVTKEKMSDNSDYFDTSLKYPLDKKEITLEDAHATALLIWCAYFHELSDGELSKLSRFVLQCDISTVWHVIDMGDKYLCTRECLIKWFQKWYKYKVNIKHMTAEFASQLALPCIWFNYAEGFAEITKWLCYNNEGHITESRPIHFQWLHQHLAPLDFVRPMNQARGRLKSVLHERIWEPAVKLSNRACCGCKRWKETIGGYHHALTLTRAYSDNKTIFRPRLSVAEIIDRLVGFKYEGDGTCDLCRRDWADDVSEAWFITEKYFDGLCIDCMDKSKPGTDENYWKDLHSVEGRWDKTCKIKHGEPTWYVSWCGCDEHRKKLWDQHQKSKPKRREIYHYHDGF